MYPKSKINSKIELLKIFIIYLEKKKIEYCFLGDPEKHITNIEGDFDFYINIKSKRLIINLVKNFCIIHDLKIANLFHHEFNAFCFVICYDDISNNSQIVHLDFCNEYVCDNRRIYKFKSENIKTIKISNHTNLKVLKPKSAFIYYLLKKIWKLNINDQELNYIFKLSMEIDDLENTDIKNFFSINITREIIDAIKSKNIIFFKQRSNFLKSEIIKINPIKLRDFYKIFNRLFFRFSYPAGIFIIILGCDGVGKTSLITKLVQASKLNHPSLVRGYKYFHFAPFFMYQSVNPKATIPNQEQPYNFIISFIKIIYLYFIFWLGYMFTAKLHLVRATGIIIDRYFYDILVDPGRYRIKLPKIIIKLFSKIVPKPELTFIITADHKQIYERKKEIQLDQINKIQNKYIELNKFIKNSYLIDNSKDLLKSEINMKNIMIDFMNNKFQKMKF
jgi:thymidylate kinase